MWFPVNFLLIESLQKFHYYLGDDFKVECPTGSGQMMTLWEVAGEISRRLNRTFLRGVDGRRPVHGASDTFQNDPHWRDLVLFYEYFHGDTGQGIGASHQTGWTGVVARAMHLFATTTPGQVLDLGKSGDQYFLALEFVDGWSLEQIRRRALAAKLKLPLPLALTIVGALCRGLAYVHTRERNGKPLGIVHRDVTAVNVMVARSGVVKLLDFGVALARLEGRERTRTGQFRGTFVYASPEQASGEELDGRSDLFSLGIVLVEVLTGIRVFDADTDIGTMRKIAECSPMDVRAVTAQLPRALAAICARALARRPADRFQDGAAFSRALREYLTALQLEPDSATAHYNLACFLATHAHDMAIEQYKEAIELDPEYPDAHLNLGMTYADLDQRDEAKAEFKAAIELDPQDPLARHELAAMLKPALESQLGRTLPDDVLVNICHYFVESGVDLLVRGLDPSIGNKLIAAAFHRSDEVPALLSRAYASDFSALAGSPENAAQKKLK